jgi:hypothetical protein
MSRIDFVRDFFPSSMVERAIVIYKTYPCEQHLDFSSNTLHSIITDGKTYEIVIENPLSKSQHGTCQCNEFLESGIGCRHIISSLMHYRDRLQKEDKEDASQNRLRKVISKRVDFHKMLSSVSKDELIAFVLNYARQDKRLATAMKVQFARHINGDNDWDKYLTILNSIIAPKWTYNKFNAADLKVLAQVLDDFYGQMHDCLAIGEYVEASYILEAALTKVAYIMHYTDQYFDIFYKISIKFHDSILEFVKEKIPPALMRKIKGNLLTLAKASYYDTHHVKSNIYYYLYEIAKVSERKILLPLLHEKFKNVKLETQKEVIFSILWKVDPSINAKDKISYLSMYNLSPTNIGRYLMEAYDRTDVIDFYLSYLEFAHFDKKLASLALDLMAKMSEIEKLHQTAIGFFKRSNDYHWIEKCKSSTTKENFSPIYSSIDKYVKDLKKEYPQNYIAHIRNSENETIIMDEIAAQGFTLDSIQTYEDALFSISPSVLSQLYNYHIDEYLEKHYGLQALKYIANLHQHIISSGKKSILLPIVRHLSIKYPDRKNLLEVFV